MSKCQQVLIVVTGKDSLRSPIEGWTCEDPNVGVRDPVGVTPPAGFNYTYPTVLHALGDGWQLLASPSYGSRFFVWWLTRVPE